MENVCKNCLYHIIDLNGVEKCILNGFVVSNSDSCTSFLNAKNFLKFIENYSVEDRIVRKIIKNYKKVLKKYNTKKCIKPLFKRFKKTRENAFFKLALLFSCVDDLVKFNEFVADEHLVDSIFNDEKYVEFTMKFNLKRNEHTAYSYYILQNIDVDELAILRNDFELSSSEIMFLLSTIL